MSNEANTVYLINESTDNAETVKRMFDIMETIGSAMADYEEAFLDADFESKEDEDTCGAWMFNHRDPERYRSFLAEEGLS